MKFLKNGKINSMGASVGVRGRSCREKGGDDGGVKRKLIF